MTGSPTGSDFQSLDHPKRKGKQTVKNLFRSTAQWVARKAASFATAAIVGAAALVSIPQPAQAEDIDYRVAVTSVAGSASFTFTNNIAGTESAFVLDNVLNGAATSATNTFTVGYVIGAPFAYAITNTATTVAGTTNRRIAITNAPTFFINDKLVFTSSDTNTFIYRPVIRRR